MTKTLIDLKVTDIKTADNVRSDLGNIVELANSIEGVGLIQPITVDENNVVITGHRRLAAMTHLVKGGTWPKDKTVQVYQNGTDTDSDRVAVQLVENVQRQDLSIWEEADAYARLSELGLKQKEIAAAVGLSGAHVSRRLSLTLIPVEMRDQMPGNPEDVEAVAKGFKISGTHAAALINEHQSFYRWDDFPIRVKRWVAEDEGREQIANRNLTSTDKIDYAEDIKRIVDPGPTDWEGVADNALVRVDSDHEGNLVINVQTPADGVEEATPAEQKMKEAAKKERAETKEVKESRMSFINEQLKRKPAQGVAVDYFVGEILHDAHVVDIQAAAKFLKAPEPNEIDSIEALSVYCPDLTKMAMIISVLKNEKNFRVPHQFKYHTDEHYHQQWMTARGYKPTKLEKSWVK